MKNIGLIGGMSWESSIEYYRLVNQGVKARLGGLHSARCMMVSVDFAEIEVLQHAGRWDELGQAMVAAAQSLESGGADFIVLCTNTMHKLADAIKTGVNIPFLHIADATAGAIKAQGLQRVGLLGTRFTMEEDFYKGRLIKQHGLDVLIPEAADRELVHRVIYNELVMGQIHTAARRAFRAVITRLIRRGAEGIVLGCTEIGLLVKEADSPRPLFDTTLIHAQAAVDYALRDEG